jgi:hypothetical protein
MTSGRNRGYPAIAKTQHDYNLMAEELRRECKERPNKPAQDPISSVCDNPRV